LDSIDPDLPVFLDLSSKLTGYSEDELEQTGMVETYYCMLMKEEDQDGIRAFFQKAKQVLSSTDVHAEIGATFIGLPNGAAGRETPFDQMPYEGLAQRINLMWYTGIWTTMNQKDVKPESERTAMISAETYKEGLIWATARTHPAGAKQPGYASWSELPV
jgi:hypothetical protein